MIGPGGKNIRALQAEYEVKIDIEEDGTVFIAAPGGEGAKRALDYIDAMMEIPEEGKIYTGKVVRVADFGAFVEILPGTDGLVHISQLSDTRIESVTDVANCRRRAAGDGHGCQPDGKVRLSRQAVLEGWTLEEAKAQDTRAAWRWSQEQHRVAGRRSGVTDALN